MITNPQIGQKVKVVSLTPDFGLPYQCLHQIGTIVEHNPHGGPPVVWVQFPERIGGHSHWWFYYEHLILATPEEQARIEDQQRRQQHADKYL